jgi:hypothetical protein
MGRSISCCELNNLIAPLPDRWSQSPVRIETDSVWVSSDRASKVGCTKEFLCHRSRESVTCLNDSLFQKQPLVE